MKTILKKKNRDFPGSPEVKTPLPLQGARVQSLGTKILHAALRSQKKKGEQSWKTHMSQFQNLPQRHSDQDSVIWA